MPLSSIWYGLGLYLLKEDIAFVLKAWPEKLRQFLFYSSQMALQEQLDRFKKQQQKCQSTLTSIAASKAAASKKPTPIVASPFSNGKSPAPAVKFSNDTERLQHINSIRKAPVGAQMKRVIDLLLEVFIQITPFSHFVPPFMPIQFHMMLSSPNFCQLTVIKKLNVHKN